MEGSYGRILQQQHNVPLQLYHFFIDKFADAIRYEIARSAERAYPSLALSDMQKMFMIDNRDALMQFITNNNNKDGIIWEVKNNRVNFTKEKRDVTEIPSLRMVNTTLDYATELNRII